MNGKSEQNFPNLTDVNTFRHWTPVSLRFSDQDSLGHINNVAYAAYVEQARVALFEKLGRPKDDQIDYILANLQIDYRREMHFPGNVNVGACLLKIGTKSITTGYGLFKDAETIATASSVNVFFNTSTRASVAISDDLRRDLERELRGD